MEDFERFGARRPAILPAVLSLDGGRAGSAVARILAALSLSSRTRCRRLAPCSPVVVSPFVAWWLSRPIRRPPMRISDQQHFPEKLARKTGGTSKTFVTAEDNWLPPDNIQQNPDTVVAPRTSPTNIGMALLADLAAFDFGYCSAAQSAGRARSTRLTRWDAWSAIAGISSIGTTRARCAAAPARMFRWSIAAIWRRICWCSRAAAMNMARLRVLPPRMFGGLCDTLRVLLDVARDAKGALLARRPASQDRTAD